MALKWSNTAEGLIVEREIKNDSPDLNCLDTNPVGIIYYQVLST